MRVGSAEFAWRYHPARSNLWWAVVSITRTEAVPSLARESHSTRVDGGRTVFPLAYRRSRIRPGVTQAILNRQSSCWRATQPSNLSHRLGGLKLDVGVRNKGPREVVQLGWSICRRPSLAAALTIALEPSTPF